MADTIDNQAAPTDSKYNGFALASLILGIISIALSLFLIGGILAVIGLILGAIHLKKRTTFRAMAIWGMSLSIAGLLASFQIGYLYYHGYKQVSPVSEEGDSVNWKGVEAPDFSMTSLDGKQIRLADLRGKRIIFDIWATWCPPCQMEIPHFIRLVKESDPNELVVVGISNEEKDVLSRFIKEKGINYSIVSASNLPSPFRDVQSIPTTFFCGSKRYNPNRLSRLQ